MMNILGIIPARYASSRFPGKPLADIQGRSMILRVCDRAAESGVFSDIIVATDDSRILSAVNVAGYQAVMTSFTHKSGTDRCREALEIHEKQAGKNYDHVINIQGDEPFIQPEQIAKVATALTAHNASIATLAKLISRYEDIIDPNVVKVIFDKNMEALYFSRAPLPFLRDRDQRHWPWEKAHYKHLGIYGYRSGTLIEISSLPEGRLEKYESLEQLRWLENGFKIRIDITDLESVAIDTPEDLLKITNIA
jgi:3-deoxy-manno-octulosonate cytidylyltransferase (CMP-KDO synthetase)